MKRQTRNTHVPVGSSTQGPTAAPAVHRGTVSPMATVHATERLSKLNIATYNIRTMSEDHHLKSLLNEVGNVKWSIIGLSEIRRVGENTIKLTEGHLLYYQGQQDKRQHGVGFLVNRSVAENVIEFHSISERIASVTIQLTKRYCMKIIQAYAPTADKPQEEIEDFFEKLGQELQRRKTQYTIVMGDFNAKVGKREQGEKYVGEHGLGIRNNSGDQLVNFATLNKLYVMNTYYKKKPQRKWTWRSPNGNTKNEIDYILTNQANIFTDVSVMNHVNCGSDHRMVRSTVKLNFQIARNKLFNKKKPPLKIESQNISKYRDLITAGLSGNQILARDDINIKNNILTDSVIKAAKESDTRTHQNSKFKFSQSTLQLMEKRRRFKCKDDREKIELSELNKTISKLQREELRRHNADVVENAAKQGKSLKAAKRKLGDGKHQFTGIKERDGTITKDRERILERAKEFYEELYSTTRNGPIDTSFLTPRLQDVPAITKAEVEHAICQMKKGKAPGEDDVPIDLLKDAGESVLEALSNLYTACLTQEDIPSTWANAVVILLHKKGDQKDLANYRPISLLCSMYKIFTKIICTRITKTLDENQPREQAGFRRGFSTTDHLQAINQLIEKMHEYNRPLCVAFIDYEKAFDSVELPSVMKALQDQGIEQNYINVMWNIYKKSTTSLRLHRESERFHIQRGVRQGDTISPKLFTACLQEIFRTLDWEEKGININGEYLSNLRFADDIILVAETAEELQSMIEGLHKASLNVGLKMNKKKTQVMYNNSAIKKDILVDGQKLDIVEKYIYLGQEVRITNADKQKEVERRIQMGWSAFGKLSTLLKQPKLPLCLKKKLYNTCIAPTMIYGCETWNLTKAQILKFRSAQRGMERLMLGVTLQDKKRAEWIRSRTRVKDIIQQIKERKWRWAGHVARMTDNRWTKRLTEWVPRDRGKRSRGRQRVRWRDEIQECAGVTWMSRARDREEWRRLEKAYVLQWT